MSHNSELTRSRKSIYVDVLMTCVFLILISFAMWLVWVTYFRANYDAGVIEFSYKDGMIDVENRVRKNNGDSNFHNAELITDSAGESLSACIMCHENYPHRESRYTRAYLNAHAFVMTCEVCHLKHDDSESLTYRWLDEATDEISDSKIEDGRYKVVPLSYKNGQFERFDRLDNIEAIKNYLDNQYKASRSFKEEMIKRTHIRVSDKAITCNACHNTDKEPAIIYTDLAYTSDRIKELLRIEVAGMIEKYNDFYIPNLIRESDTEQ